MFGTEFGDIFTAVFVELGFEESFCLQLGRLVKRWIATSRWGFERVWQGEYLECDFIVRPIPFNIIAPLRKKNLKSSVRLHSNTLRSQFKVCHKVPIISLFQK